MDSSFEVHEKSNSTSDDGAKNASPTLHVESIPPSNDLSKNHLHGSRLLLVMIGLILCLFLPALDQLILTTAMPRIVSQFNTLSQISWIPNAYFLTMASFMIIFGQILNLAPLKYVIAASIFLFELGSLFCGIAFNMNFLLFGRGLSGVGAAGLTVCIYTAVAQVAPLEKRPQLMGATGATFGVSSVLGPLVGGALTDHASWRWCFYINLPIGAIAAVAVFFFLPNYPAPPKPPNRQGWRGILGVDYVGSLLVIGMTITLLYPLVDGGNTHPWNSAIIIALFTVSGILLGLFIVWSWYIGPNAILPLRLLKNRSVVGASLSGFFIWMGIMLGAIYIATWYQAVKGNTPTQSGINILPYALGSSGFVVISGMLVGRFGRYWHVLVIGPLIGCVGAGLEYTINENTPTARLVGYQIIWAASLGATLQLPTLAGQAQFQNDLVDTRFATSLVTFLGFLGRMVGIGMGSALFTNKLSQSLKIFAPNAPDIVLHSVDAIWQLPLEQRASVIHAYVLSLRYIFILGVPAGGLASLFALLVRNKNLNARDLSKEEDVNVNAGAA